MRQLTQILSWTALAGAVAAGVLFFLIGKSKERLSSQLLAAQQHGQQLAVDLGAAETANAELHERIQTLDAELATAKRALTASTVELEQRQRALELAEADLATAQAAAQTARTELAQAQVDLTYARDQLATALPADEAIRYRQTIAQLEDHVMELEATVRSASTPLVAGRGNHAQVVGVGPQNAFVVINFGESHGARPNQQLRVTRGLDLLALVEISETRENYSVAQVLPNSLSGKLRKGDAATLTP